MMRIFVLARHLLLIAGLLAFASPGLSQIRTTKSVNQLTHELREGSVEVRRRAAEEIAKLGYETIPAVPALSAALKDEDGEVRSAAALAISKIGPEAAAAVPSLIGMLNDRNPAARERALIALGNIGPDSAPATKALQDILQNDAADQASLAVNAMERIGEPAIPALIVATRHADAKVRGRSVLALRSLGPNAKTAVPTLMEALRDSDDWVRRYACWALGGVGTDAKEALPALRNRLKDTNLHFRLDAAEAMLLIDSSAADAIEILKSEAMLRQMPLYAASALSVVPAEAETGLELLVKTLDEKEPAWKQDMAIHAIVRFGPKKGLAAVPRLQAIARNPRAANRLVAAETLTALTGKQEELLTLIVEELTSKSEQRKIASLKALAKLGPGGKELSERTIPLLKDDSWPVREAARFTIKQITR
jgi:HEAT repeat protein